MQAKFARCLVTGHECVRFEAEMNGRRTETMDVVGCTHCYTVWGGPLDWPLPAADRSVKMDVKPLDDRMFTTHAYKRLVRGDY